MWQCSVLTDTYPIFETDAKIDISEFYNNDVLADSNIFYKHVT